MSLSILVLLFVTLTVSLTQLREDVAQLQRKENKIVQVLKQQEDTNVYISNDSDATFHRNGSLIPSFNITNPPSFILAHHNVSLCTQIRNEPIEDVIEWLTFYRYVYSVNGICFINDGSTIDYTNVFDEFNVKTIPSRNDRNQNFDLCQSCLSSTNPHDRLFVSDVDEYLYIEQEEVFGEYLSLFNQVSFYALNFANAAQTRARHDTSLVLDNERRAPHYCRHESFNNSLSCRDACWYDTVKSISRNAAVQQYLTHTSQVHGITVPMPCDVASLNHYFIRSQDDFRDKYKWEENSNWSVASKYKHVLDNIQHYTAVQDDRLKNYVLDKIPNYAELLQEYKNALLSNS